MKTTIERTVPATVDQYLERLPAAHRVALEDLRKVIRSEAPQAEEVISYQIPTYKFHGPLVHFAAFKDHLSFFPGRRLQDFEKELEGYSIKGTTVHFSPEKPLPANVVKKIVQARLKENASLASKANDTKATLKKISKLPDNEKVEEFMLQLKHPLKAEIEAVRTIIKRANKKIAERVKWNAPSYYYKQDIVTFNLRATKHIHLVFHHASVVNIQSRLLKGDYKDRRTMYFSSMDEVKADKQELTDIINELVRLIDNDKI